MFTVIPMIRQTMISIPDSGTYARLVRTGVSTLIRAREGDSCRGLRTRASHDIELCALHVELSSGVGGRAVQGCEAPLLELRTTEVGRGMRKKRTNDLVAENEVAGYAARDGDGRGVVVRCASISIAD